ncbi:MAG: RNA 2'-phosphotransferase [Actinobacteria bacterium]|nr:RNA 2'-phosphotransferase [Actinomycetota bacterium]
MTVGDQDLSRVVSHALRHEPWLYELELDEEGWVPVGQLLTALHEKGGAWQRVDRDALARMLVNATKRRHEIDGERIRALYGHSVPGRVHKLPSEPPAVLFHGTAPETWPEIESSGLLPMARQFVHLSVDRAVALSVGRRKSERPVIVEVDAKAAASSGVVFYEGNDLVWLAASVPSRFLERG